MGHRYRYLSLVAAAVLTATALSACGSGEKEGQITLAYQRSTDAQNRVIDGFLEKVADTYEHKHPGTHVKLEPITASENDYYTKMELMMRSKRTAPDVVYEDTFIIASDATAGYLRPLNHDVTSWPGWKQIESHPKSAVSTADGKIYGIPNNTDTRALWYNKQLFRKAGLPVPWRPKSWDDILAAARTIKKKLPGVTPLNVYTGKGAGEGASMQGFEMLLYGTKSRLYDADTQRWSVDDRGFRDALQFVHTVYGEGLGPSPSTALDPNIASTVSTSLLPSGKLAINLDGSWINSTWAPGGPKPWPQWKTTMATTPMPTQHGQSPGSVTLAGGWAWSIPTNAVHPDLALGLIKDLSSKDNMLTFNLATQNITVRSDVAQEAKYVASAPTTKFFTDLLAHAEYRPSVSAYPQISTAIQQAMERVTTGGSVTEAARSYDDAVRDAVGKGSVSQAAGAGH